MTLTAVLISAAILWFLLGLVAWMATVIVEGGRQRRQGTRRKRPNYLQVAFSAVLMWLMGPFAWLIVRTAYRGRHHR